MTRLVGIVVSCLLAISAIVVTAGPGKPQVSVGLNTALLDKGLLNALEPIIQWETSESFPNGADIEGGFKLTVQDDGDMPCSFWGRLKKSAAFGSKLSCLVETSTKDFHHISVDLRATKDSASLQMTGSITAEEEQTKATNKSKSKSKIQQARQASFELQSVKLSQSIRDPLVGGRLTVTPRYNVIKGKADITTSYGLAGTFVTLDANPETQKLSIRQEILGGSIKPSLDTNGKVEVQYTRPLGASGSLTASYKHDDSLGLTYEKGSLVATVVAPPVQDLISLSCKPQDVKFSIRKAVYLTD